jgi:hypothetical protein
LIAFNSKITRTFNDNQIVSVSFKIPSNSFKIPSNSFKISIFAEIAMVSSRAIQKLHKLLRTKTVEFYKNSTNVQSCSILPEKCWKNCLKKKNTNTATDEVCDSF